MKLEWSRYCCKKNAWYEEIWNSQFFV